MTTCVALLETIASSRITEVQFGLLNPELVKKQSVVRVNKPTLYVRQLPMPHGLNDLRMGTSDRRLPCGTCKNDVLSCVGHVGHIELAAPMYHTSMINMVMKVLRCVCFFCSRLLINTDEDLRVKDERFRTSDPKDRLNLMVNLCKTRHFCRHCGGPQPKYKQMRSSVQIKTEFRPKDVEKFECTDEHEFVLQPFTATHARAILQYIPDDEVELLGINPKYARPEWLILTVLQVPPPIARPSIMATDGSRARGQDDVTIKLQDIVKANNVVEAAMRDAALHPHDIMSPVPPDVLSACDSLQLHLCQFMHHDSGAAMATAGAAHGGPPRSNRPLRLIPARIKGKKGRFRGTLGGKRVDYSARTVVSPAPGYDIDEVGVPLMIAQHLTFAERVTKFNIEELTQRVKNGPSQLVGAVAVIMPDGTLVDLTLCDVRHNIDLQLGWVVERYLKDGDLVLFNRQPSLHRMSIMAHRVRIIPDKTFRLPICDTTPYNADFDGDEMNLHVLRTYEAVAEAKELMSVKTQLISPQSNKPIIGLVQDSLVAVFLMTHKDTLLTRSQVMQMVMPIHYPLFDKLPLPAILKPVPLWTGKQIFSLLFPPFSLDVTVRSGVADGVDKHPDGAMDIGERRVIVSRGELVAGSLCKKTMGTSAGGIIHVIVKDCGNEVASRFISDAQRILVEFLLLRGFSVGIGDCMMGADTHRKVVASIDRSLAYSDRIVRDAGDAPPQLLEACLSKLMGGVLTRAGAVVQEDLFADNRVYTMVQSGAKGSAVNIAQILACVGQQSVEGGRIATDIHGRTLPCYPRHDTTAESRGFVSNSYGTGLTAQEYFFHAMGGREGLVDTAVKTASTGYIQRRLVKAEEGLQVRYDHTVRNTKEQIVQFYYGGDSFDPVYVEKQSLNTFGKSDAQLKDMFGFDASALHSATGVAAAAAPHAFDEWQAALDVENATLRADRDTMRTAKFRLQAEPDAAVFVTVAPQRLLVRARERFGIKSTSRSDMLRPRLALSILDAMYKEILSMRRCTATWVTVAFVRTVLSLKAVVIVNRLTRAALRWIASEVVRAYRMSLAAPGEMVGTLGAASIGEPCTQMTLNTFHLAGVGEKTVTLGVPRLKELIDVSRSIKTPSAAVYFEPPYSLATSEGMARRFGVSMEHTLLRHVVLNSSIKYDPDPWNTLIADDRDMVQQYAALYDKSVAVSGNDETDSTTSGGSSMGSTRPAPWIVRFVLNREVLARKHLTVVNVAAAIQAYMGDCAQIMRSEVNMLNWCIRLRVCNLSLLLKEVDEGLDMEERTQLEEACMKTVHDFLLDNVTVHGVHGIHRAMVHTAKRTVVDAGSGAVQHLSEWMVDTEGTNLRCLLTIPFVDKLRTISNDVHEVLDVLGIEAAQQVLLEEIRAVLSFDGSYVNERHLQLLVDVMTLSGTLTAMTRHSMHKLGGSTYHHASFEETQDVLIHAAAFGTHDKVCGVTESLMMGMLMPGGTGACDVMLSKEAQAAVDARAQPTVVVKPLEFAGASTSGGGGGMDVDEARHVVVQPLFPGAYIGLGVGSPPPSIVVKPLVLAPEPPHQPGLPTVLSSDAVDAAESTRAQKKRRVTPLPIKRGGGVQGAAQPPPHQEQHPQQHSVPVPGQGVNRHPYAYAMAAATTPPARPKVMVAKVVKERPPGAGTGTGTGAGGSSSSGSGSAIVQRSFIPLSPTHVPQPPRAFRPLSPLLFHDQSA